MLTRAPKARKFAKEMSDTKQGVTVISGRNTREGSQVMTRKQTAAYLQISTAHLSNVLNGKVPGVAPLRHAVVGLT